MADCELLVASSVPHRVIPDRVTEAQLPFLHHERASHAAVRAVDNSERLQSHLG